MSCLISKYQLAMKTHFTLSFLMMLLITVTAWSQDDEYQINTIFRNHGPRASGGYGAISNKFTTINGDFANMVEVYGGWYINHRFLLGIGAAATTNNIPVLLEHSMDKSVKMSYEYAQCGLMTEYVIASDRAIHIAAQLFTGAGFTLQYERYNWQDDEYWDDVHYNDTTMTKTGL
jgi:hypothetical protein